MLMNESRVELERLGRIAAILENGGEKRNIIFMYDVPNKLSINTGPTRHGA
jgi:hypothetical protein